MNWRNKKYKIYSREGNASGLIVKWIWRLELPKFVVKLNIIPESYTVWKRFIAGRGSLKVYISNFFLFYDWFFSSNSNIITISTIRNMRKGVGRDPTAGKFLNHKIKFSVFPVLSWCTSFWTFAVFKPLCNWDLWTKFLICPDSKACWHFLPWGYGDGLVNWSSWTDSKLKLVFLVGCIAVHRQRKTKCQLFISLWWSVHLIKLINW